jgi:hypothetical protein
MPGTGYAMRIGRRLFDKDDLCNDLDLQLMQLLTATLA